MPKIISLFTILLLSFALPVAAETKKITVVASFSILSDMVHEVAGDNVKLITLVGANGDAHVFEPTPADAKVIATADLIIVNGLGFEGWLDRLIASSGYKGPVVIASEGIKPILNDRVPDPHAWQDIMNGKLYVINIAAALAKADPENAGTYAANATRYIQQLSAVDSWVRTVIGEVPAAKRRAITSHDSLRYFAHAYHVEFIAPLGISTSGEPGARFIAQLIDLMHSKQVRAVFLENMADPRLVKQLATDGGGILGGTLYSDALSEPTGPAPTYIDMFKHNAATLAQAMAQN